MKYRFQIPVKGRDTSEQWFIGEGQFDEATGEFTGDLTLDFEHHWGPEHKDHKPKHRIQAQAGADADCVWLYASSSNGYYVVGVSSLPIINVERLDLANALVLSPVDAVPAPKAPIPIWIPGKPPESVDLAWLRLETHNPDGEPYVQVVLGCLDYDADSSDRSWFVAADWIGESSLDPIEGVISHWQDFSIPTAKV